MVFITYWWSSSETDPTYAWNRSLHYNYDYLGRSNDYKENGFSVRCLRD